MIKARTPQRVISHPYMIDENKKKHKKKLELLVMTYVQSHSFMFL